MCSCNRKLCPHNWRGVLIGVALYLLPSLCLANSGLYVLRQPAGQVGVKTATGRQFVGDASCVCVGVATDGTSCVLTAGHNIADRRPGAVYRIVSSQDVEHPATVLFSVADGTCDIAVLACKSKLKPVTVRETAAAVGETALLQGVLNGRYQESTGTVQHVSQHVVTVADMWSYPGMSGGPVTIDGELVGVFFGDAQGDGLFAGEHCIAGCIGRFHQRYGRFVPQPAASGKPTLYIFKAAYCGPCKLLANERDKDDVFEAALTTHFAVRTLDVGSQEGLRLANRYGVDVVPAAVAVNSDGDVLARTKGFASDEADRNGVKAAKARFLNDLDTAVPQVRAYQERSQVVYCRPQCHCSRCGVSSTQIQHAVAIWLESNLDRIRGRDGSNGKDGRSVSVESVAEYLVTHYRDQIRGADGQDGADGPQITVQQVAEYLVTHHADQLRGVQGPAGPGGPPGPAGPATDVDLQELIARIVELETRKRRVLLVEDGNVLDDESYGPDEPIVLDLKRIVKQSGSK